MTNLANALDFLLLGGLLANVLISLSIAAGWPRTLSDREQRVVAGFLCALYSGSVVAVASDHPVLDLVSAAALGGMPWVIFFWFLWLWGRS